MALPISIPREYTARVTATQKISPKIIVVQAIPNKPVPYHPGQYASWLIDQYRRPLSYATPADYPYIEFVVDVSPNGIASRYVAALQAGDTIRFLSPYGRFVLDPTITRPHYFVATGSGIGPLRAHILAALAQPSGPLLTLIFGNKDEHYFFLDDEFTELAHLHSRFSFIPVCSEPGEQWTGQRGLVTDILAAQANLSGNEYYICGGPVMVVDTVALLQKNDVPLVQIHTEKFT